MSLRPPIRVVLISYGCVPYPTLVYAPTQVIGENMHVDALSTLDSSIQPNQTQQLPGEASCTNRFHLRGVWPDGLYDIRQVYSSYILTLSTTVESYSGPLKYTVYNTVYYNYTV